MRLSDKFLKNTRGTKKVKETERVSEWKSEHKKLGQWLGLRGEGR